MRRRDLRVGQPVALRSRRGDRLPSQVVVTHIDDDASVGVRWIDEDGRRGPRWPSTTGR